MLRLILLLLKSLIHFNFELNVFIYLSFLKGIFIRQLFTVLDVIINLVKSLFLLVKRALNFVQLFYYVRSSSFKRDHLLITIINFIHVFLVFNLQLMEVNEL